MSEKKFNLSQTGAQVQEILNSAKSTDQVLTEIQEAMEDLPDGQAVSAQVALNTAAIQELDANKASKTEVVFDISAYHATGGVLAEYADLTAALGTNGANIPDALRKGGMSVKFVQSSDNKYVQYRLAASGWSTDIHDWTSEDPYFIDKIMQEVNEAIDEHTPIEITGDVTNAPDEEDLTSVNVGGTDILKFKDRAYNPLTYSGMGRKILRRNIVNGVNTLTQSMISDANTIYIIQYDFTLGEDITIPANCVLEFDGGSLRSESLASVNFNHTYIISKGTVFYNIIPSAIGNKEIESFWFDWSTQGNNSNILQGIFDSLFIQKGGIFRLSNSIDYNDTITIKTEYVNSYSGGIIKVIGYSTTDSALIHHGNSDGIVCIGYDNDSETTSPNIVLENFYIRNITEEPSEDCVAIKLQGGGSHFTVKNVCIRTPREEHNYGFYSPNSWVYSFIDCEIHSYNGIVINGGTSAYIRNVFFSCTNRGLHLSGGYCVIENAFGDYSEGTLFYFSYAYVSITSLGAESPKCNTYVYANQSNIHINCCYFFRQRNDDAGIFRLIDSVVVVDQLVVENHLGNTTPLGWLSYKPFNGKLEIGHLKIDVPFKHYHTEFEDGRNSYVYAGNKLNRSIVKGTQGDFQTYIDWYMEMPKYKMNNIIHGFSAPKTNGGMEDIKWYTGAPAGTIMLNSFPEQFGSVLGWVKRSDGIYNNSAYKAIPFIEIANNISQLDTISEDYKGVSAFFNTKPIWWAGTAWLDADGAIVALGVYKNLTHLTLTGNKVAEARATYNATLSADQGYSLPAAITVKMGGNTLIVGTDYTYNSSTGEISILGNGGTGGVVSKITITAIAV